MLRSISQRTRRARALTVIICGVGLTGSDAPRNATTPSLVQSRFETYEVVFGSANRQSVLTGFLLGGAIAELGIVAVDENKRRRLHVYAFENSTWIPRLDATLRPEVLFVDVANIGGHDRVVTYEPGRVHWFDPETQAESALAAVTSNFQPPRRDEIPHVDITRDVNGDGRDDLVVPDVDGFWIVVQRADGAFAEPVKIGPPTDMSRILGADGYRYDPWSQSRIHVMDYDHDGRSDLVFWNDDHFVVHLQNQRGAFAPAARTFRTGVAFGSDDLSSLASGRMTGRVLHSLTDLNGDSVADLVIHSLVGTRIPDKQSAYEVHFGARSPDGGTAFDSTIGATFQSGSSIQLGFRVLGSDRDGQVAVMITTIDKRYLESSLWKRLRGFMGDDVNMRLELYRSNDGLYAHQPSAERIIALDGAPSLREPGWVPLDLVLRGGAHERRKSDAAWPRAFNRTLHVGDVTGDGRPDLLLEREFTELNLFVGVPGPSMFAQQPETLAVLLHDREYSWLVDLNRDGKQDMLVHHPFTLRDPHGGPSLPPGSEPHRMTILVAR